MNKINFTHETWGLIHHMDVEPKRSNPRSFEGYICVEKDKSRKELIILGDEQKPATFYGRTKKEAMYNAHLMSCSTMMYDELVKVESYLQEFCKHLTDEHPAMVLLQSVDECLHVARG